MKFVNAYAKKEMDEAFIKRKLEQYRHEAFIQYTFDVGVLLKQATLIPREITHER